MLSTGGAGVDTGSTGWLTGGALLPQAVHTRRARARVCIAATLPPERARYASRMASYAESVAYDRDSELKHEYEAGEIRERDRATLRHSALAVRISAPLSALRARGCIGFGSDLRVRVLSTGRATYPDVTVCGAIERDPADPSNQTVANPTVLVEVLSPSTEHDDRGAKWHHYQPIAARVRPGEPDVSPYRGLSTP